MCARGEISWKRDQNARSVIVGIYTSGRIKHSCVEDVDTIQEMSSEINDAIL